MSTKMKYKVTDEIGEDSYFSNIRDICKFLKVDNRLSRKIIQTGERYKGFIVEELDVPFEFKTPKIDDVVMIQNIECKVINVYQKSFSVITDQGTGVVRLKDMKFASLSHGGDQKRIGRLWL